MNDIECNFVVENLSAFLDKELPKETSGQIKKHLCNCLTCRRAFSKLLKLQHTIKNYFENNSKNNFKADIDSILDTVKSSS